MWNIKALALTVQKLLARIKFSKIGVILQGQGHIVQKKLYQRKVLSQGILKKWNKMQFKFGWNWPNDSVEEDENVKSLQTTDNRRSEKLTWAYLRWVNKSMRHDIP